MTPEIWLVVPCYNEADRLRESAIALLLARPDLGLVLVDDGSTDRTDEVIADIKRRFSAQIETLALIRNMGKAEAVRQGMNHAHQLGARVTGFIDADFATPPSEVLRLLECLESNETIEVLIGSRWLHLGARIDRGFVRHYAGRLFATVASGILQMPIYDTQCGTKFFRVNETFLAAIDEPFLSRWSFDVELIGRLFAGGYPLKVFREEPLETWIDVSGSKINMFDMLRATLELVPIASELRRIRRATRT